MSEEKILIEERRKKVITELERPTKARKHRFTAVGCILTAYFAYWTIILMIPHTGFSTYNIYGNLELIISEVTLTHLMLLVFYALLIGQFTGFKWIRLSALACSMIIWSVIALSFIQKDWESMRGSVLILAVASGYQFVKVFRERRD